MNSNNNTNIVAMHMAQELADELHSKGIYYEMSDEQSKTYPFAICNIGGHINAISCFTEKKRSSESYFLLDGRDGWRAKAGSLSEVMMTLKAQGVKTKLERELDNLAKAIRLTGRNAEVKNGEVVFGDVKIGVIIYGFSPCYNYEGKWTYNLEKLFELAGIDTLNGLKIGSPVEISYDKYGIKCEAIGTFYHFRFDFEYRGGVRELVNVGAFVHVVSRGELLGGGVEAESETMRPHVPTQDRPFRGKRHGKVLDFRLADNYMADTADGLFKLIDFGLHVK